MAEIVNFYEDYIYPLLEDSYDTIEQVWEVWSTPPKATPVSSTIF